MKKYLLVVVGIAAIYLVASQIFDGNDGSLSNSTGVDEPGAESGLEPKPEGHKEAVSSIAAAPISNSLDSSAKQNLEKLLNELQPSGGWKVSQLAGQGPHRISGLKLDRFNDQTQVDAFVERLVNAISPNSTVSLAEKGKSASSLLWDYRQSHHGKPVFDGTIRVAVDKNSHQAYMVNLNIKPIEMDSEMTSLTDAKSLSILKSHIGLRFGKLHKRKGPMICKEGGPQLCHVYYVELSGPSDHRMYLVGHETQSVVFEESKRYH